MKPRVAFVLEQALGHVAYGMGLRQALADRDDIDCVWLEVPFAQDGFGRLPVIGKNWTLRGSYRARRSISRAEHERPLDALFIHTQTIGLLSAGHMAKIPTLLSLDATPINYDELATWYGDRVAGARVENAKRWLHQSVMRRAAALTAWSKWAADSLTRDYGVPAHKISVIHPGTVHANFPAQARGERRPGPLRLLFVGGDFKRKGGDLLTRLCRTHFAGRIELHLVTSPQDVAADNVFVHTGLRPHSPELLARYADADVFVLPTRADCLAVVLGEAMAAELPIITTRVGAHAEAVEDGQSGFLIDVDDELALRDRLERLLAEPGLAQRLGRRSRELGRAHFDMIKNANRIADTLVELARRGRAG
jgi:glycosyltransferase involved in cell wall biosynthesis